MLAARHDDDDPFGQCRLIYMNRLKYLHIEMCVCVCVCIYEESEIFRYIL